MKPLLILAFMLIAALSPLSSARASTAIDDQYNQMVAAAQTMPRNFDFDRARALYAQSSYYKPYETVIKIDLTPLMESAAKGDKQAFAKIEEYCMRNFALIEAHSRAMAVARALKDENRALYHEWAVRGLITALRASGDALSEETAPKPLLISEEYLVARQFGQVLGQRIAQGQHKAYDVLSVKPKDGSAPVDLWFDITHMLMKQE